MLFARGELRYDPTFIRLHVGLGRRIEFSIVERQACTYDTRYLPVRTNEDSDRLLFHIYLAGKLELAGASIATPCVLFGTESHYSGTKEQTPTPLRAGGEHFLKIELKLPAADVRLAPPATPTVLPTSAAFFETTRAFAEAVRAEETSAQARDKLLEGWMMTLAKEGWIGSETFRAFADTESSGLMRLWHAFAPSFATIDLNVSLGLLSSRAGVTARQLTRNVDQLLERIGYPLGFRSLVTEWRLRVAVMLLSAPHAKADEVVKMVGYASSDSMATAFRDAGLPSPREVQAAMSKPL